jgi:hypothetical protein
VQGRTLNFGLSEGAMITSGAWFLEMTHDFKSWERLVEFSPGNVAAFAQDTVPEGDFRPRFYGAIFGFIKEERVRFAKRAVRTVLPISVSFQESRKHQTVMSGRPT